MSINLSDFQVIGNNGLYSKTPPSVSCYRILPEKKVVIPWRYSKKPRTYPTVDFPPVNVSVQQRHSKEPLNGSLAISPEQQNIFDDIDKLFLAYLVYLALDKECPF
jgi:hypothetical protein